jgi:hypothetical protein
VSIYPGISLTANEKIALLFNGGSCRIVFLNAELFHCEPLDILPFVFAGIPLETT